jgi:hypothetical protein
MRQQAGVGLACGSSIRRQQETEQVSVDFPHGRCPTYDQAHDQIHDGRHGCTRGAQSDLSTCRLPVRCKGDVLHTLLVRSMRMNPCTSQGGASHLIASWPVSCAGPRSHACHARPDKPDRCADSRRQPHRKPAMLTRNTWGALLSILWRCWV